MTTTVAMEFDLEDRLGGVMSYVEARGIMGTAGELHMRRMCTRNGGICGRTRRKGS